VFSNAPGAARDLSEYHSTDASKNYNQYYDALRAAQAAPILRGLSDLQPPPANLLDIGCGNGVFVKAAADAGYESRGIDTSLPPHECAHAANRVFQGSVFDEVEQGRVYDVVTILNVLEHIPDPNRFLSAVVRLLSPGGICACAMPLSSGTIYRACEVLCKLSFGSLSMPLKTVLQWHMAAPHVFLPTSQGICRIMQRYFGDRPSKMRTQKIVDVRNLHRRIALEQKQRHVSAPELAMLYIGGYGLGVAGRAAATLGRPDEVFFFVERKIDA